MKIFFAFVLMVAAVSALPASKNSARLPLNCERVINDDFTFRWGILGGVIEFEIQANTTGWVGLAMADASPDVLVGDIWMGGYDEVTRRPYLEDRFLDLSLNPPPNGGVLDVRPSDLALESSFYAAPWTFLRFSRLLDTRDPEDLPITDKVITGSWTFAATDDMNAEHDIVNSGFFPINLVNNRADCN